MSDLISRQAAIKAIVGVTNCESLRELYEYSTKYGRIDGRSVGLVDAADAVIGLPSAQPEIIRCKDCKAYDSHDKRCKVWNHGVAEYEYCYRGWKE